MGKLLQRLQDASRSGVYRVRRDAEVLDAAASGGLAFKPISLRGARTKDELLRRVAGALQFPDWFGNNWDALEDCLTEVRGYFLISDYEGLDADDLGVFVDVLASGAEYWAQRGEAFFAVFVDPAGALNVKDLFREA